MKFSDISIRAANVGGRIHRMNTPGGDLVPGYVMASKALLRQVMRDGSITIKRCPHCGQMMK